jgi:A/G-specific adenine glycosylase
MSLIEILIEWYNDNKRDLPWRHSTDPYVIWLSEIILQQTRVDQGLPYFYKFLDAYPTVSDFASADEGEVLNHWQGLGYYSRGRNMHKTANMVMEDYAGYFPKKYEELIKLKGVGEYTAAAISSFSNNEARAVVDGNVFRLLARYYGINEPINTPKAKKLFTTLANEVIDSKNPAISNQAMMEFGSLHCKPKKPLCYTCPLQLNCFAFQKKLVDQLPQKLKKAAVRERFFNYFVLIQDGEILLNKRGGNDIWENLHEFPMIETESCLELSELIKAQQVKDTFEDLQINYSVGPVKHLLSHQKIFAQFIVLDEKSKLNYMKETWFYTDIENLKSLAQPKLVFSFVKIYLS